MILSRSTSSDSERNRASKVFLVWASSNCAKEDMIGRVVSPKKIISPLDSILERRELLKVYSKVELLYSCLDTIYDHDFDVIVKH